MNAFKTCFIFISLLTFYACDTEESVDVEDQKRIYAHYKVETNKDSDKISARVTFYEEQGELFNDYVALRGSSYVEFQNYRMQEVRDFFDHTHYENSYTQETSVNSNQKYIFQYVNNDGEEFINQISLPSFAEIKPETIKITYYPEKIIAKFAWFFSKENENKNQTNLNVSFVFPNSNFTTQVNSNPATIEIHTDSQKPTLEVKNIKLCSSIKSRAEGVSGRDTKESSYCDKEQIIQQ